MSPRVFLPTARLALRSLRTPIRFTSNTTTSRTARVIEMAAQAERPSAVEAAVPVMWAVCGGLAFAAWNRIEAREGSENVEKVCWF